VLFDRGRRRLALKRLNVGSYRDGLNVFDVPVAGPLTPEKKLFDCPVISCPGVGVPDRDRKKFEELFLG
jgi:hypothetical protein